MRKAAAKAAAFFFGAEHMAFPALLRLHVKSYPSPVNSRACAARAAPDRPEGGRFGSG
ncbi:hypothetical protein ROE7235_01607 [Roseibaca ekhonensis]|uniref:Uncharacterized protein n=1 Tax=Roseinatronobacter ekhonensis TaxID=254356 RepID=A0A3B0MVK5_9RHOB|nr:hypothetical protein ROE7235_01607 [Roseibaca ekhonensis]